MDLILAFTGLSARFSGKPTLVLRSACACMCAVRVRERKREEEQKMGGNEMSRGSAFGTTSETLLIY